MRLDDECLLLYRQAKKSASLGNVAFAERLYRKIRRDHGCELYWEIDLPEYVKLVHPVGTVLGRARYEDWLVVYQGVSVGSTIDNERPTFTGPCCLLPHSSVIGPVTVGANVWVSAHTKIEALPGKPEMVSDNCIVYGTGGGWATRLTTRSVRATYWPEDGWGSDARM